VNSGVDIYIAQYDNTQEEGQKATQHPG